ncbi:hypothetical protein MHBO_001971 [Bonamia ostreae]|uniref:C2 domain-containing protein n=1 Tax=Bonamia ostreae TaxID=126728 RepID=A0ABV2AKW7_9EUKA
METYPPDISELKYLINVRILQAFLKQSIISSTGFKEIECVVTEGPISKSTSKQKISNNPIWNEPVNFVFTFNPGTFFKISIVVSTPKNKNKKVIAHGITSFKWPLTVTEWVIVPLYTQVVSGITEEQHVGSIELQVVCKKSFCDENEINSYDYSHACRINIKV